MTVVTSIYLTKVPRKVEQGKRGFPGGPGPGSGQAYPSAGIALSDGSGWLTSLASTGTGTVVRSEAPTLTGAVVLPATTTIGTVTDTEISYLSGVSSAIQAQINAKASSLSPTLTGTVTITGDLGVGNVTDGTTLELIGKGGSSYTYNFSTKTGGVLRIVSNKAGALPFDLDADGGIVCGKIDLTGAFAGTGKALILRNTTAAANGNEITQNFYFKSSAWTNNLQAQIALVTNGYSSSKLVYRSHDLAESSADALIERFEVTTTGSLKIDSTESLATAYSTGFFGDGYKIIETGGETTAEFDNLIVRKMMRVFLLEVDKIDVIGGSLIISPASGTVYNVVGTNLYFDTNNNTNPIQFKIGDYIAAQQWVNYDHTTLASYRGHVTAVHQSATLGDAYIETTTVSGTAWVGMRLAQLGSSADVARQNLLYLTSSDTNNPFIEAHTGVSAGVFTDTTRKFRLGNLTGVTDPTYGALSGFGLYSQNVYLTGWIKATSGSIGGWTIDSDSIYTGTKQTGNGFTASGITIHSNSSIHAMNFYLNTDGTAMITSLIDMAHLTKKKASDTDENTHTAEVHNDSVVYSKKKTITITYGLLGIQRFKFELKSNAGTYTVYAKIMRNGVLIGSEQSTVSSSYSYKTQDITQDWAHGDTCELWLKADVDSSCYARNFKICYDTDTQTAVASANS
jgi:hypothetical protein